MCAIMFTVCAYIFTLILHIFPYALHSLDWFNSLELFVAVQQGNVYRKWNHLVYDWIHTYICKYL